MSLFFMKTLLACTMLVFAVSMVSSDAIAKDDKEGKNPVVVLKTNMGDVEIELFQKEAPISVKNFLWYVENEFYEGLIFHRIIPNFMVQGGGFNIKMKQKEGNAPIVNEATNGLLNDRGTLAMARTNVINSASSQFFINLVDNSSLNHRAKTQQGFGYAVFAKVIGGMDVVDKMAKAKTQSHMGYNDVPTDPIVIEKAYVVGKSKKKK
ncbi:MAG: peptidylprolyl isomerase [Deltaproteobacteria bacterium]|nr:peptidylprolyl isomerase [Deltaproteobacteria bacterium]